MTALPNPSIIRVMFDSYAEALAASIVAGVTRIWVDGCAYVEDAAGTALTTNNGARKWSPLGMATLPHWGVTGTALVPGAAGQLNEPSAAEQAGIEAALLWCGLNARELYGDTSRVYGVTGPLSVGASTGSRSWGIHDLNLYVKAWTASVIPRYGDDPDAWEQDAAVLTVGSNGANPLRFFRMSNVHIDCARLAGTGVRYLNAHQLNVDDVTVDRARTFGHDIGRPRYGSLTTVNSTASRFSRLRSREYWFSSDPADGYTDWTVRTSCGIRISGSDCAVAESEFSTAAVCGAVAQGYHVSVNNCIFWGTPTGAGAPGYADRTTLLVGKYACNYRFNSCRFDDARVVVHGAPVPVGESFLPSFQGKFVGCSFIQYDLPQLVIVAHEPEEEATNFVFLGNNVMNEYAVTLSTSGSGTWGDFRGEWVGNNKEDGTSWTVQGKSLIQGFFTVYIDGRVRAAALTPTVSTPGESAMWCVGEDGYIYTYGTGGWRVHAGVPLT